MKTNHRGAANVRTSEYREKKRAATASFRKNRGSAAFARFTAVNLGLAVLGLSALPSQTARATTWANATELNGTLTSAGTGGLYTYSGTLALGDTIQAAAASAGLATNTLYYVTAVNGSTYTLSATPGGAAITGVATGSTVAVNGVYSWNATAASGVQNGASWTGAVVPNATDAVATISSFSNNAGNNADITIQQNVTIGTVTVTQTTKQWTLISSNLGTSSTLAALDFVTNTTPGGPLIDTSGSNQLLRLGDNDVSFKGGTLKISGTQGLTLSLGSAGARIESVDWSGFTDGASGKGTITLQQGLATNSSAGNVFGTGANSLNVTLGNTNSPSGATAPELNLGGGLTVNNLNGTVNGHISGAQTLTIGDGNGTNTDFLGTIGLTASNVNFATNVTKTGSGTQTISGEIVGTGANVTVNGASGMLILKGTNSYSGTTTVTSGTLAGIGSNAFGSTSGISIAGAGILSLRGDTSTSFAQASGGASYAVTTTASGATINADEATVAGTGAKTMSIGTLGTTVTATPYQVNFTGADNTSLSIGAVTGPASTSAGTTTLANSITGGGALTLASYTSANTSGGESLVFNGSGNTTVSGAITQNGSNALALTYGGTGVLTLSASSGYAGGTTVSSGTVKLGNASALGTGALTSLLGTLDVNGNAITNSVPDKAIGSTTNSGTITNSGAAVILTGMGNIGASATRFFTLSGTGNMTFGQQITGSYSVTKNGSNTVFFTGANTYTGTTTISGGNLTVGNGTTGSLNGTTGTALTFGGTGTANFDEAANSSQGMGVLTLSAGDATIQSTYVGVSPNTTLLTFTNLQTRSVGATANFIASVGTSLTNKIKLTDFEGNAIQDDTLLDPGIFFGGSSYASYTDPQGVYDVQADGSSDTNYVTATGSNNIANTSTSNVALTGSVTAQASAGINTLNMGAYSLGLQSGAAFTTNGILVSNGSPTISGGTSLTTTTSKGELVIRTNLASDSLTVSTPIIDNSGTTLTKSGAGLLTLTGSNTYAGATFINAGTLTLDSTQGTASLANTNAVILAGGAELRLVSSTGTNTTMLNSNAYLYVSNTSGTPNIQLDLNSTTASQSVFALIYNGVAQPIGLYSNTTEPAGATIPESDFNANADTDFGGELNVTSTPEPGSLSLLVLGGLALMHRKRRTVARRFEV